MTMLQSFVMAMMILKMHANIHATPVVTAFHLPIPAYRAQYRLSYHHQQHPPPHRLRYPHDKLLHPLHMFTGIVEDIGTIVAFEEQPHSNDEQGVTAVWDGTTSTTNSSSTIMTIQTSSSLHTNPNDSILASAYLGCSISVSGVCLTATHLDLQQHQFTVGLAPETLRKTYFGSSTTTTTSSSSSSSPLSSTMIGRRVNLERAAAISNGSAANGVDTATSRNSGHYVQGHIDDVGTIVNRIQDQDSLVYTVQVPASIFPYIVPKGFIAVDGTSLTVITTDIDTSTFTFMLIAYTQQHTIIPTKQIGDLVNIEVDILSKYAIANQYNSNYNNNMDLSQLLSRLHTLEQRITQLEDQVNAATVNRL
jgi:riboflavin synthase